jgi:hypothetical protein
LAGAAGWARDGAAATSKAAVRSKDAIDALTADPYKMAAPLSRGGPPEYETGGKESLTAEFRAATSALGD